jgi:phosphate transport system protein
MSIKKDLAITSITEDLEKFSELTLIQLNHFMEVIRTGEVQIDKTLLEEISDNEKRIDKYDVKVSDKITNTIMLYHPMASDLRKIMACYRISGNLERVGDLVYDCIYLLNNIKNPDLFHNFTKLLMKMLTVSTEMLQKSLIAFNFSDKESAMAVMKEEKNVDKLHQKLIERMVKKTEIGEKTSRFLATFLSIRNILSNIERIADHATNIAEAAIYAFEGVDIRHQKKLSDL